MIILVNLFLVLCADRRLSDGHRLCVPYTIKSIFPSIHFIYRKLVE